jgi:hypothetical protein
VEKGDDNNRIKGELRLLFPPLFPPSLYVLFKLILVLEGRAAAKDEGGAMHVACSQSGRRKIPQTIRTQPVKLPIKYSYLPK